MKKTLFALFSLLSISAFAQVQSPETRLLRFPAIHGNQVVFSYAGDLYTVERKGGTARKLTSHSGYETFPRFSEDGSKIAFTGQYDGNTEVFLIPATGGEPKRLTITPTLGRDEVSDRMGPNNVVMTWTRDNKNIVFRSRMNSFNAFKGSLFSVPVEGGMPTQLPLSFAGWCSYSPDGSKLAFNKVFREFRTWKYYKGGMADDLWIYDLNKKTVERIVEHISQDVMPMWHGNKIYFISDRDRIMNIFCVDLDTKVVTKVTDFKEFDVKFPSIGGDDIIFENGGYLHVYNIPSGKSEKLSISVADDQELGREKFVDASKNIESMSLAPDGSRLLFCARGDLFSVPHKSGVTRNLSRSSGLHERNPAWSPDGKFIAFLSDKTGEDEIYIQVQDGSKEPVQLTRNADTYKYRLEWSPDSKNILWADKKLRLQYLNIETKTVVQVDAAQAWEFSEYDWSPDSKFIAYTKELPQTKPIILIYDTESKKTNPVTDSWYESGRPQFSADGKYLFFVSNRDFNPIYSATEWNTAYADMEKIYIAILGKSTLSPLGPENNEVNMTPEKKEDKTQTAVSVTIDWAGLSDRIISLPVKAANYFNLGQAGGNLFYMMRSQAEEKSSMMFYDFKKKKEIKLGNADGFQISFDRKQIVISSEGNFYRPEEIPDEKLELKDKIDLGGMTVWIDRNEEWNEIFRECWRQMRDFFFDPNMHGVDWATIRKKYEPLLPFVKNRADLTYIIGEMIGELSVGHAYVGDGDLTKPERIKLGLLGATIEIEKLSGFVKVTKVLEGENWSAELRSPLTEPGVNVVAGEYIIEVNGVPVNSVSNFNLLMTGTANRLTELTVNNRPSIDGSRKVIVKPLIEEASLYYFNWVENNIRKVNEATNGRVGYVHIPDMGPHGLNEFMKHFYPQMNKEALIVDVRGNGGGNVSPMIIERLKRELDMITISRNTIAGPNPADQVLGPKVALIDNYSASDGDIFSYRFRKNQLGKLVGQRTWGGVVGIRGSLPLVDGGYLNRPEFSRYDNEGKEWILEGTGVYPDIEVLNDPAKEFLGEDQQLNKGIEVILEELKTKAIKISAPPPYPDKSK